jgi:hypothetical protein
MTRIVQHRRGTTTSLSTILGAPGELFVDTSLVTVVVHDGVTTGGTTLARNADLTTVSSNAYIAATTKATSSTFGIVRADGTSVLVTGGVISVATVQTDGTSISSVAGILRIATSSNGFGLRTVSTSAPAGGSHGDIWYQV